MKIIFLSIVLFFAVGVMMLLVARLTRTQQRLADLHRDLKRTDEKLQRQQLELQRRVAEQEARDDSRNS